MEAAGQTNVSSRSIVAVPKSVLFLRGLGEAKRVVLRLPTNRMKAF